MEDGVNRAEVISSHDLGDEIFLVHVVGNIQIDQVGELGAVFEVVDHENIVTALLVECFYEVAADHTGTTSYYNHGSSSL